MDHFARLLLVPGIPSIADPVGEAIAAEARQTHQVDILGIVAMAQMAHQAAKGRGGDIVGKRIERVGLGIRIHEGAYSLSCNTGVA